MPLKIKSNQLIADYLISKNKMVYLSGDRDFESYAGGIVKKANKKKKPIFINRPQGDIFG